VNDGIPSRHYRHLNQAQMLRHRMEIAVVVEQRLAVLVCGIDAGCRRAVERFSRALSAKTTLEAPSRFWPAPSR
jgi:hypothetical protein